MSFFTAAVLAGSAAIAQHFYEGNFLLNAVLTAVILWIGFTAARMITHDLFDRRPSSLTVLNLAHELVTVVVMGLIIGAFGFPAEAGNSRLRARVVRSGPHPAGRARHRTGPGLRFHQRLS